MNRKALTMIGAGIAAAGLTFGAISIASADDTAPTGAPAAEQAREHEAEAELTGADAQQAIAAAQAAVPDGIVVRVETDRRGDAAYEAHVHKTDGTHVVVSMDSDFKVTSVQEHQGRGPRDRGTPLTGADAEKATAAAQAAVADGTVLGVFGEDDGTYVAHVRKADGTPVRVSMDSDFKVTSVQEHEGRGPRDRGTPLTGADAEKATAAAQAAVADGTVLRVFGEDDGTYVAHVRKADGTPVRVEMDSDFKVTSVQEHQGRGPRGGEGDGNGPESPAPGA